MGNFLKDNKTALELGGLGALGIYGGMTNAKAAGQGAQLQQQLSSLAQPQQALGNAALTSTMAGNLGPGEAQALQAAQAQTAQAQSGGAVSSQQATEAIATTFSNLLNTQLNQAITLLNSADQYLQQAYLQGYQATVATQQNTTQFYSGLARANPPQPTDGGGTAINLPGEQPPNKGSPGLPAYPTVQAPAIPTPRPDPAAPPPPGRNPALSARCRHHSVLACPPPSLERSKRSIPQILRLRPDTPKPQMQQGGRARRKVHLMPNRARRLPGSHGRETQELNQLDQGPYKPKQDTLAGMGALFMLVGKAGAFLGGKGSASAASQAPAAHSGIVQGWSKGTDAEFARQKAVFDENANCLKDQSAESARNLQGSL